MTEQEKKEMWLKYKLAQRSYEMDYLEDDLGTDPGSWTTVLVILAALFAILSFMIWWSAAP